MHPRAPGQFLAVWLQTLGALKKEKMCHLCHLWGAREMNLFSCTLPFPRSPFVSLKGTDSEWVVLGRLRDLKHFGFQGILLGSFCFLMFHRWHNWKRFQRGVIMYYCRMVSTFIKAILVQLPPPLAGVKSQSRKTENAKMLQQSWGKNEAFAKHLTWTSQHLLPNIQNRCASKGSREYYTKESKMCKDNYTWEWWRKRQGQVVEVDCGEVRYRNGFGEWRLHPLDKLFGGVGLRDKSTSPFNVFLFLPVLFCKQEKENKKNKQINKNMGGAVWYHIQIELNQAAPK